jgi:hypothetical protein
MKTRRLHQIRHLLATLPADAVAVYEDEVDIHLNPKIGLDWMGFGQQKEAQTPGQNEKRYLAGAKDVRTGTIHWATRRTVAGKSNRCQRCQQEELTGNVSLRRPCET